MSEREQPSQSAGEVWLKIIHTPWCFKCEVPFGHWQNDVTIHQASGRMIQISLCDECCADLEAGALDLCIPWDVQDERTPVDGEEPPF